MIKSDLLLLQTTPTSAHNPLLAGLDVARCGAVSGRPLQRMQAKCGDVDAPRQAHLELMA